MGYENIYDFRHLNTKSTHSWQMFQFNMHISFQNEIVYEKYRISSFLEEEQQQHWRMQICSSAKKQQFNF